MSDFIYPDALHKTDELYKKAQRVYRDDAIFGDRKALLEKHFDEYPIYLDESYYCHEDTFPRVKKSDLERLYGWRECHYYSLMEYNGIKFYIMRGGRYD